MKKIAILLAVAMLLVPLAACSKPSAPEGELPPFIEDTTQNEPPMSEEDPSETPEVHTPADEKEVETEQPQQPALAHYLAVEADGLNVRAGAGTDHKTLGQAQRDTLLPFCGEENGWCETRYCGKTAYVSARYTSPRSLACAEEAIEAVIREGCRLLGTPYVYGATRLHDGKGHLLGGFTAEKFDCSSLMQYIFYRGAGVLLDVTTRTQIAQGVHVDVEDLRRGDLMFFTNASRKNKSGVERVGHVALYLGGGYILHTASDFAKIEKISPLRQSYFLEARRILG